MGAARDFEPVEFRAAAHCVLGKIAIADSTAADALMDVRPIADGAHWRVRELICHAGPESPSFEEQHAWTGVAVVMSGSFHYRSLHGRETLVAGALLLTNRNACFECGHEHGSGDRCMAFQFAPELVESAFGGDARFHCHRIPPLNATLRLTTAAGMASTDTCVWEDLALSLLDAAIDLSGKPLPHSSFDPRAHSAVERLSRELDALPQQPWTLQMMSDHSGLETLRLIRQFRRCVGCTPYQYVLRQRLTRAAQSLMTSSATVQHIALDCGFNDLSEFTRRFGRLFGVPPNGFRHRHRLATRQPGP
jgi:AraC family transcriptional regulator